SARRLKPHLAIAGTLGAAWAVSHYSTAARRGSVLVPSAEQKDFLAPLPLEALRLNEHSLSLLQQFGLETIGDLMALPRASLTSRLGSEPLTRLDQALGLLPEAICGLAEPSEYRVAWEFESPTEK